jgi:hypothetical protein
MLLQVIAQLIVQLSKNQQQQQQQDQLVLQDQLVPAQGCRTRQSAAPNVLHATPMT